MSDLDLEVPDVHPIYQDPVHGWMCLRHGGCKPALVLRDWFTKTEVEVQGVLMAQHTYTAQCDGIHEPGPCP